MAHDPNSVAVVVVTRNRKAMLKRCLAALAAQTRPPGRVFVVDNASSDGTAELIREEFRSAEYLRLEENLGGAYGFHEGMKAALAAGFGWIWTMDDDCFADPRALEKLTEAAKDGAVYGSVTLSEEGGGALACGRVSWLDAGKETPVSDVSSFGGIAAAETAGIGFGGLFISRGVIALVGLPRKDFFIYGDDSEYSRRIRIRHGIRMFYVPGSVIRHPPLRLREVKLFGRRVQIVESSPWRAYYNVRNQAYVRRLYSAGGWPDFTWYLVRQAGFLALRAFFVDDGEHCRRFYLYMLALLDGARGRMGKRDFKEVQGG